MVDVSRVILAVDSTQVKGATKELNKMQSAGQTAETSVAKLGRALTAAVGAFSLAAATQKVIAYSDAWQNASNQLRQVTDTTSQLISTQEILVDLANETRSSFDATATLYSKLARSTTELGLSQEDLLGITKAINQSFAVSGASAQEAEGAIRQLAQGLASGALRGDEFNSVAENAPGIMRAIAQSLNMTIGELREFAATGGITAEIVVSALQKASSTIDNEFSKSVQTFGQSMTIASNNIIEFVGNADAVTNTVQLVGRGIVLLSENIGIATKAVITLGLAMASEKILSFAGVIGNSTRSLLSMTAATQAAIFALRTLGRVAVIGALVEGVSIVIDKIQEMNRFVAETPATWAAAARLAADSFANSLLSALVAVGRGIYNLAATITDPLIEAFAAVGDALPQLLFGGLSKEDAFAQVADRVAARFDSALSKVGKDFTNDLNTRFVDIASDQDRKLLEDWRSTEKVVQEVDNVKTALGKLQDQEIKTTDVIEAANDNRKTALQSYAEEATNVFDQIDQATTSAFRGMEDALVDFVQTGKLDFKSLADSIIADIIRIQIRAAITGPIAELISGKGGSGSGGISSIFGSVFSGDGGQTFGTGGPLSNPGGPLSYGGARAVGGPVSAGMMYEVNERGPELLNVGNRQFLMMGQQGGSVTPNHAIGGGAMPPINVNIINQGEPLDQQSRTERRNSEGGIDIDLLVDKSVSQSVRERSSMTSTALRGVYGNRERLTQR